MSLLVDSKIEVHSESDCDLLSQLLLYSSVSQPPEVGVSFHSGAPEFISSGFPPHFFFTSS